MSEPRLIECNHCGKLFGSRAALARHRGGVGREIQRRAAAKKRAESSGPRWWTPGGAGVWVGVGEDGRPWLAFEPDKLPGLDP